MPLSSTVPESYVVVFNVLEIAMLLAFIYIYLGKIRLFRTNNAVSGVQYMELLLIPACFLACYVAVPLFLITFMF